MEITEIMEPFELHYSDLILLSSNESSSSSSDEIGRLKSITRRVMEELGPEGPGLLAITGVPGASHLRRTLLPLARNLALLNHDDRKRVLKEHNLGSDVPLKNLNRTVSSFAMQLKYSQTVDHSSDKQRPSAERLGEVHDKEYMNLGNTFKELGFIMMELGLHLARICDREFGCNDLEHSLLESSAAKGRLIHYHSAMDNTMIKESAKRKGSRKVHETKLYDNQASNLWQQWHYDYGIFTVLTAPMFITSSNQQTTSGTGDSCLPCEHIHLQIFHPNKNRVLMVRASSESFIVQVGESADIISKGKLRSTLHSVSRPLMLENVSRETFVLFLQPAWNKKFSLSDYPIEDLNSGNHTNQTRHTKQDQEELMQEIQKIVPPLLSRLKDGMSFAEFSRETTKQYYGGSGLQSRR